MDINNILEARDNRVALQESLQKKYRNTLIVNRVNMPGIEKNTPLSRGIFSVVDAELGKLLEHKVLFEKKIISAEGPVMVRVVDMSPEKLKAMTITMENEAPLGRFVDLDVYNSDGESMSRTELGFKPRACYLCSAIAHECVRSKRHRLSDLLKFMENAYQKQAYNK